ncbi:arginine ABC transporter permease ArtQ [Candidatus Gillettellia adelgis]
MYNILSLVNSTIMTMGLAVFALTFGLILAILFAILESSRWKIVSWLSTILVILVRSLPEILVVLFMYVSLLQLTLLLSNGFILNLGMCQLAVHFKMHNLAISLFLCGVCALALIYSAHASQTLRGAFKAVPRGQWESGQTLGMSKTTIFFRLIMPQMWRYALPSLSNQWLVLLKDTSLVSLISLNDLMSQTKNIAIRTQQPFTWYMIAAIIYLSVTLLSQHIMKYIERRATNFERKVN